ncbi:MAG TPA: type VI secretion system-associated protein TagF [Alcaligenes sp.]|nr:type VI secretion system-associated protein TagF [Alcaligenes faecalis]HRL21940.1 type VI secretion system-associated protein TagF [Alcaligenes sp.]
MLNDELDANLAVMWYGKIPAMGDFVRRRMPDSILLPWERWFSSGVSQIRPFTKPAGVNLAGSAVPVWGFVRSLPQGGVQAGAVMPSQDRVGREYLVCALVALDLEQCQRVRLPVLASLVEQLGLVLQQGVRFCWAATQVDQTLCRALPVAGLLADSAAARLEQREAGQDILDVLYGTRGGAVPQDPWAVLQPCLEPGSQRSYWWCLGMNNPNWRSVTHRGELSLALFRRLFTSVIAADLDGRLSQSW